MHSKQKHKHEAPIYGIAIDRLHVIYRLKFSTSHEHEHIGHEQQSEAAEVKSVNTCSTSSNNSNSDETFTESTEDTCCTRDSTESNVMGHTSVIVLDVQYFKDGEARPRLRSEAWYKTCQALLTSGSQNII